MADFAPPSGPPPPKVPAGYKAVWNDQYKEWFYVNIYTKQSQWDKPTEPVYDHPTGDAPPGGPPPSYDHNRAQNTGPEKGGLGTNNPYAAGKTGGLGGSTADDEALARRLQEEENARVNSSRGASDGYYQGAPQHQQYGQPSPGGTAYGQQQSSPPAGDQKKGLFSKLGFGGSSSKPQQQQYGGYPQQQYPPQGQGYGGGYPPQQQYGGYPPQQQYGGYPQQQYAQQAIPAKKHGMGGMGGAALGLGGGLLGGALLADAFEHHDQNEYNQGYEQGQQADDGGGDYGGGDDGGDMGGGDF